MRWSPARHVAIACRRLSKDIQDGEVSNGGSVWIFQERPKRTYCLPLPISEPINSRDLSMFMEEGDPVVVQGYETLGVGQERYIPLNSKPFKEQKNQLTALSKRAGMTIIVVETGTGHFYAVENGRVEKLSRQDLQDYLEERLAAAFPEEDF